MLPEATPWPPPGYILWLWTFIMLSCTVSINHNVMFHKYEEYYQQSSANFWDKHICLQAAKFNSQATQAA